jgi:hypothetical protein
MDLTRMFLTRTTTGRFVLIDAAGDRAVEDTVDGAVVHDTAEGLAELVERIPDLAPAFRVGWLPTVAGPLLDALEEEA